MHSVIVRKHMDTFACRLVHEKYCGWNAIQLSNGLIDLFIVPEIGGRIIQLRLGSRNLLYVNQRHQGRVYAKAENCAATGWKNYGGSKVWPAPQGWQTKEQWPGPPDPILDGGAYGWRIVEDNAQSVAITLESQHDEYTGVTFSREIRLHENLSEVQILHAIRNSSSRRVRWGIWQVTQHNASPCLLIYAPAGRYWQMFGDKPFQHIDTDPENGFWKLTYTNQVAKFALEAKAGWLAAVRPDDRITLVEEFPLFPDQTYPDDAPAEVWVNGSGTFTIPGGRIDMDQDPNGCDPFIETEILSPLIQLDPGQEYKFPVTWRATTLPFPSLTQVNSLAVISNPLTVERDGQELNASCGFGAFQPGSAELLSLSRDGSIKDITRLCDITPLEPCRVDERLIFDDSIGRIRLQLKDLAGRLLGTVDEGEV
jgi:hypothetical protein